jgi:predicted porin
MKKIVLLAVMLVMSASAAFSQVSFGVKGGLNLANATNLEGETDMKTSFYVGGLMEYRISDFFGISPELLYSRQGVQYKEEGVTVRVRLNYINLPVLAKIYVAEELSLDLGPQFGFSIDSDIWAKSGSQTATLDLPNSDYGIPSPNAFDVSFAMGLTYNFSKCFVQGRYNLGLTNIFEDDEMNSKHSVIQVGVGYRF